MKNLLRNFTLVVISFLTFSCEEEENKNIPSTSIAKIIEVTPEFSKLKEALEITGLTSTFEGSGDFTVFVPTNTAFTPVLGGLTVEEFDTANPGVLETILKHHVLGARVMSTGLTDGQVARTLLGQDVTIRLEANPNFPDIDPELGVVEEKSIFINESRVFARDVNCSNGIIHVINAVLQPKTIVDIASANPDFSILVRALERTNLVSTLDGSGQFTVFAPTDAAFNTFFTSLGSGVTVDNVPEDTLKAILLNHVIGSKIKSGALPAATYASTLSPINATATSPTISMFVQKSGSVVTINGGSANGGATVTSADLEASNGVIHVVGNVIAIPTIVNHVIANPDFDTLQAVVTSTSGAFGDQSGVLNALVGLTSAAPATLFAPNNTAFTNATTGTGFAAGATAAQVSTVLQYHVTTAGNVRSSQLTNNQVVPMFTNPVQDVTVILGTGTVDIKDTANNSSRVFQADIQASNGVIHGVDRVLQPAL
jgi:uncharacterized surface protein with fasciclin (FAS1) repeats